MPNFLRRFLLTAWSIPFLSSFAAAQNADLHVLISNGVKAATEELLPPAEASLHRHAITQYGAASVLKQKIMSGEAFDAAILTTDAIDDLVQQGKIVKASRVGVARIGLGVGIRAGAAKPDIRTPEALKRTLLEAKSITYNPNGATRPFINKMFAQLGIAEQMKSKLMLEAESDRSQKDVAEGKAAIIVTLVPEVTSVAGVQLVGPLPAEVQGYINFSAGVAVGSKNSEAASALIKAVTGPSAAPVLKSKGMEPR
jgi:molybdate transport system substrate-binding protein